MKKLFKNPKYPDMHTIDLRYVNSKNVYFWNLWGKPEVLIIFTGLILLSLVIFQGLSIFTPASAEGHTDIRSSIRQERLEVCQEAYQASGIREQFIYGQIPAVRCATYMGLVYAFESGFGESRMCIEDNNCFGMKGNGIDTPAGDLKFNNQREGREYFAKKYFQWHYKKDINTFVHNWAMGNRAPYIAFMRDRFHGMYGELEKQYLF